MNKLLNEKGAINEQRKNEGYAISELRPRLFLLNDSAVNGRGVTLSGLIKRAASVAYREWITFEGKINGWFELPSVAMRYLLEGKREDALAIGEFLAETPYPHEDITAYGAAFGGIAFDWVREALPEELAHKAADKLVEGIGPIYDSLEQPAVNHNYTYVSLYALAVGALAIYGESPEYTEKAVQYLKRIKFLIEGEGMILDTFRNKSGVWAEGNHYSPYVVLTPFLMTMAAVTSSTGTDYFKIIRERYNNFLAPMGMYITACMRPDWTLERIGDMGSRWVNPNSTQMRPTVELIAKEQGDAILMGQLRSFCEEMQKYHGETLVPDYYKWMMLALYDASLPVEPSYKTLPLSMRLGENAYEQIMMRNGWEEDSTLITTICGDHYTDHQHFDKGSFLIYNKGGLAIDSGAYASMYMEHWSNYAVRTLAHNCVLIVDPDEKPYKAFNDVTIYPDGGQRVIRGVQSNKNWQDYLEAREEHGADTARVLDCEFDQENGYYNYVKSDLTVAYGIKAALVERQLVYLPKVNYLVIKDRVVSSKPMKKSWLLHFSERPQVDGNTPADGLTEYAGGSFVREERTGEVVHTGRTVAFGGALLVKSLLPEKRTITAIGGEGYRCYNRQVEMDFDDPENPSFNPFAPIRESGNWRIEVTPEDEAEGTVFLHAFELTDADKKDMVPTEYVKSDENLMEGVLFDNTGNSQLVMFRKGTDKVDYTADTANTMAFEYTINTSGPVVHILTELQPQMEFSVTINGQPAGVCRSSAAGVLSFRDVAAGQRKVSVRS